MTNQNIFITIIISSSILLLFIGLPYFINVVKSIIKRSKYNQLGTSSKIRLVRQLDEAVTQLSKEKTGAIITIVQKHNLDGLRTDGIKIDANISAPLIISIFNKKSPTHDGAIIINKNKIEYAGTYYKITSKSIDNRYGARHRAAMGISEQSDALTIVVSEETGSVTFSFNSQFHKVATNDFQEKLTEFLK